MTDAGTAWGPEHFIGGDPALDFANTVFGRQQPTEDKELLRSPQDLANWLRVAGLIDQPRAAALARIASEELVETARAVREAAFSVFDGIAANRRPASESLGFLLVTAGAGLESGAIELGTGQVSSGGTRTSARSAIPAFLALLTVEAYFALPSERVRSCPRCGWLFVDTSKGGKRRWCSMRTCGNREKVSRHREHASR